MPNPIDVQVVTLSRAELYGLLQQAAQRGAELALTKKKLAESAPGALVNRKTMAGLLGVSVASLDRFVLPPSKRGGVGLPFVRVGQHRKFNPDVVMAFWAELQAQKGE